MTEKKEKILDTALILFTEKGYANTSTSSIAKRAGVSEGLIFKHFSSKEGLLDALIEQGVANMSKNIQPYLDEKEPKKLLNNALDFVSLIYQNDITSWRLQMSLKYQSPEIAQKYHDQYIFKRVDIALEKAFRELGYENPKAETRLFNMITKSLMSDFIGADKIEIEAFIKFTKEKYNLL